MNFSSVNNTNQNNLFSANKGLIGSGSITGQQPTSSPLFGGQLNQPQISQSNTLGGIQNPQQQSNLSLLGGVPNNQTNMNNSLFNKSTGTVTLGNLSGQNNLFGGNQTAPQVASSGLFGIAPSGAQNPTVQVSMQNILNQQLNPLNYKKEQDKKEIIDVVQSYLNCLNIQSPLNSFKYMLYNRVTDDSLHLINFLQMPKNQDITEEGEPFLIDQELWHKALRNNPDPKLFYPSQICSPKALDARAKILEILEYQKLDYLINLRQKINNLSILYDNDIQNINSNIKNKLNLIKHKQMNVIYKLEKLAILTGKADKNYNLENKINLKLNDIKHAITNKDSYVNRLKNLSSMTSLMSFDNSIDVEEDPLKDFSKERFEKNIAVLKNMKKIFDMNFVKLRKSVGDLNSIKSDLDNFKKYERINK